MQQQHVNRHGLQARQALANGTGALNHRGHRGHGGRMGIPIRGRRGSPGGGRSPRPKFNLSLDVLALERRRGYERILGYRPLCSSGSSVVGNPRRRLVGPEHGRPRAGVRQLRLALPGRQGVEVVLAAGGRLRAEFCPSPFRGQNKPSNFRADRHMILATWLLNRPEKISAPKPCSPPPPLKGGVVTKKEACPPFFVRKSWPDKDLRK